MERLVENWLLNRTQRVAIVGSSSNWLPVSSRVPKGSFLGPILFLLFINEINNGLTGKIMKFADDTKLNRVIKQKDTVNLQKVIGKVADLGFNTIKCKVVHLGIKKIPNTTTI